VDAAFAMVNALDPHHALGDARRVDAKGVAMLGRWTVPGDVRGRAPRRRAARPDPAEVQQAFRRHRSRGQLQLGYRPGDGGVLDIPRAERRDNHGLQILLKALGKAGKLIESTPRIALRFERQPHRAVDRGPTSL
jgi:hypothetical protein